MEWQLAKLCAASGFLFPLAEFIGIRRLKGTQAIQTIEQCLGGQEYRVVKLIMFDLRTQNKKKPFMLVRP